MKDKVIKFFRNLPDAPHEQFNKAFELYRQSDGKSAGTERSVNAMGYTPAALQNLLYDLQKLHGITDVEKEPVLVVVKEEITTPDERIAILEGIVSLVPEKYGDYIEALKDSKYNLENLLQFAVSVGNEKAVEVLNSVILSLAEPTYGKSPLIIDLVSEVAKRANLEVIDSLVALLENELDEWLAKSLLSLEDFTGLLEFAKSIDNPQAVEIINNIIGLKFVDGVLQLDPNSVVPGTQEQTTPEALEGLKAVNENLQSENEELHDENFGLQEQNEELTNEVERLKSSPKITAQSIRVEFPFLNNADCPDEFKILIADKITAWNRYLTVQEELAKIEAGEVTATDSEKAKLAKEAVDCFDENQKIYDELNAYQTTGKVLGSHPLFKRLQLSREVETMSADELVKYKNSSSKYFSDNKKQLAEAEKGKDEEQVIKINSRVDERKMKLDLVNKKLGIPAK